MKKLTQAQQKLVNKLMKKGSYIIETVVEHPDKRTSRTIARYTYHYNGNSEPISSGAVPSSLISLGMIKETNGKYFLTSKEKPFKLSDFTEKQKEVLYELFKLTLKGNIQITQSFACIVNNTVYYEVPKRTGVSLIGKEAIINSEKGYTLSPRVVTLFESVINKNTKKEKADVVKELSKDLETHYIRQNYDGNLANLILSCITNLKKHPNSYLILETIQGKNNVKIVDYTSIGLDLNKYTQVKHLNSYSMSKKEISHALHYLESNKYISKEQSKNNLIVYKNNKR